jgi:hypothetical protein
MDPVAADHHRRPWWSRSGFKLALSVCLLAILLRRTDLSDLLGVVSGANRVWVFAAFVGYVISQVVSARRWQTLARPLGFPQPFSYFFAAYFTGMYLNLFAPSTVAGDIARALYIARGKHRKSLAFTTVLADRGLGFVVLCWIGAFAILLQPTYRVPAVLYYGAWVVPPATLLGWFYVPALVVRLFAPDHRIRRLVEKDLASYWVDYRLLLETSLVAAVFHGIQIGTQILLARALDLDIAWPFFFVFVPVVNILGMLPISFSGIGIREGGYLFFLSQVGVDRPTAVALGLLSSAVVLASGITGGLVYLLWKAPRLPAHAHLPANDEDA